MKWCAQLVCVSDSRSVAKSDEMICDHYVIGMITLGEV